MSISTELAALPADIQARVELAGEHWIWTGMSHVGNGGLKRYARVYSDGKMRYASRVIYELANGPVTGRLRQDCLVSLCVAPGHYFRPRDRWPSETQRPKSVDSDDRFFRKLKRLVERHEAARAGRSA